MRRGVGGMKPDLAFQAGEEAGHRLILGARLDRPGWVKRQGVPATGGVVGEQEDDGRPGQRGEVGPNRRARSDRRRGTGRGGSSGRARGCRRRGRPSSRRGARRGRSSPARSPSAGVIARRRVKPRLWVRTRGGRRPGATRRETCRGRWTRRRSGTPWRSSHPSAGRCAPRWLPTTIAPRPRASASARWSHAPATSNRASTCRRRSDPRSAGRARRSARGARPAPAQRRRLVPIGPEDAPGSDCHARGDLASQARPARDDQRVPSHPSAAVRPRSGPSRSDPGTTTP